MRVPRILKTIDKKTEFLDNPDNWLKIAKVGTAAVVAALIAEKITEKIFDADEVELTERDDSID